MAQSQSRTTVLDQHLHDPAQFRSCSNPIYYVKKHNYIFHVSLVIHLQVHREERKGNLNISSLNHSSCTVAF